MCAKLFQSLVKPGLDGIDIPTGQPGDFREFQIFIIAQVHDRLRFRSQGADQRPEVVVRRRRVTVRQLDAVDVNRFPAAPPTAQLPQTLVDQNPVEPTAQIPLLPQRTVSGNRPDNRILDDIQRILRLPDVTVGDPVKTRAVLPQIFGQLIPAGRHSMVHR